jgi:hypothetical protein
MGDISIPDSTENTLCVHYQVQGLVVTICTASFDIKTFAVYSHSVFVCLSNGNTLCSLWGQNCGFMHNVQCVHFSLQRAGAVLESNHCVQWESSRTRKYTVWLECRLLGVNSWHIQLSLLVRALCYTTRVFRLVGATVAAVTAIYQSHSTPQLKRKGGCFPVCKAAGWVSRPYTSSWCPSKVWVEL